MRRNFNSSSLYSNSYADEENADPRVGLVNLADVMLVFACGLMIALVSHWHVNLSEVASIDEAAMDEVDDVQQMVDDMMSGQSAFNERGRVFQDPATGQLYLLEVETDEQVEKSSESDKDSAEAVMTTE